MITGVPCRETSSRGWLLKSHLTEQAGKSGWELIPVKGMTDNKCFGCYGWQGVYHSDTINKEKAFGTATPQWSQCRARSVKGFMCLWFPKWQLCSKLGKKPGFGKLPVALHLALKSTASDSASLTCQHGLFKLSCWFIHFIIRYTSYHIF